MKSASDTTVRIDWDRMPEYTADAHRLRAEALKDGIALVWRWIVGLMRRPATDSARLA